MKKLQILLAIAAMGFTFAACGDDDDANDKDNSKSDVVDGGNTDGGNTDGGNTDSGSSETTDEESCNPVTFKEKCDGNVAVYCEGTSYTDETEGEVARIDCGSDYACDVSTSENYADCYAEDEICTIGATGTRCYDDSYYGSYTFPTECVKFDSGNGHWLSSAQTEDDYTDCDSTQLCNAEGNACVTAKEITSTSCSFSSTEDKCESGKLVSCDYNDDDEAVLVKTDCARIGLTCAEIADYNIADCVSDKSSCTAGKTKTGCDDSYFLPYEYTEECVKWSNNAYHAVETSYAFCVDACNDAGTSCDEKGTEEYE